VPALFTLLIHWLLWNLGHSAGFTWDIGYLGLLDMAFVSSVITSRTFRDALDDGVDGALHCWPNGGRSIPA
jgi:hypothetical protein